jgi:hypothetical protein
MDQVQVLGNSMHKYATNISMVLASSDAVEGKGSA